LSSTGALTGVPTLAGNTTFTVTATNSQGTATQEVTISVSPANAAPAFTSSTTLAAGVVGTVYAGHQFAATGFPAPAFAMVDILPPGLTLSPSGELTGTPTTVGSTTFTISATNSTSTVTQTVTLVVTAALTSPTFTSSTTVAGGTVGTVYAGHTFTATGNPSTMAYTASGLPAGLTLNSSTGALSGTPTAAGTFSATITATNSTGATNQSVSIVIAAYVPTVVYYQNHGALAIGAASPGIQFYRNTGWVNMTVVNGITGQTVAQQDGNQQAATNNTGGSTYMALGMQIKLTVNLTPGTYTFEGSRYVNSPATQQPWTVSSNGSSVTSAASNAWVNIPTLTFTVTSAGNQDIIMTSTTPTSSSRFYYIDDFKVTKIGV
jgi:Putative Ig domain